jgi:preprotein translocase subunit YajC
MLNALLLTLIYFATIISVMAFIRFRIDRKEHKKIIYDYRKMMDSVSRSHVDTKGELQFDESEKFYH